jgi:hypothetical protein
VSKDKGTKKARKSPKTKATSPILPEQTKKIKVSVGLIGIE